MRTRAGGFGGLAGFVLCVPAIAAVLLPLGCGTGSEKAVVVVYTTTDQVEARKIFDAFERETGIEVKPVFDTEAQKTTGLAMRLMAEKSRPQADVFWNNELSRTLMLFDEGVLAPYQSPSAADIPDRWKDDSGKWASFSWRARVIVYNTEKVTAEDAPKTLEELAAAKWKNQVAIANPLFGTTACHTAGLADVWGEDKALEYFVRLRANGARVYEGNSVVRDAVAGGEVLVGLTDTDDVMAGKARGMKIEMVFPDQGEGSGTLVIPNSVALVAGAPHEKEARQLADYLLSRDVERVFSAGGTGQFPVRDDLAAGIPEAPRDLRVLAVDWASVAANTTAFSRKVSEVLK